MAKARDLVKRLPFRGGRGPRERFTPPPVPDAIRGPRRWPRDFHAIQEGPGSGVSYPGFVELSPSRGLVSWYSSHEKDDSGKAITAIYLAELEIAD